MFMNSGFGLLSLNPAKWVGERVGKYKFRGCRQAHGRQLIGRQSQSAALAVPCDSGRAANDQKLLLALTALLAHICSFVPDQQRNPGRMSTTILPSQGRFSLGNVNPSRALPETGTKFN
jgi:hypothetical protein